MPYNVSIPDPAIDIIRVKATDVTWYSSRKMIRALQKSKVYNSVSSLFFFFLLLTITRSSRLAEIRTYYGLCIYRLLD